MISFTFSVAGGAGAPAEARNRVAGRLEGDLDGKVLDTLRLLVSEVATNCVQHANAGPDGRIDVAVSLPPGAVRVELSTDGPPFQAGSGKPAQADPFDEDGRGLYIVDALSSSWGAGPHGSNQVWFELAT